MQVKHEHILRVFLELQQNFSELLLKSFESAILAQDNGLGKEARQAYMIVAEFFTDCLPEEGSKELEDLAKKLKIIDK